MKKLNSNRDLWSTRRKCQTLTVFPSFIKNCSLFNKLQSAFAPQAGLQYAEFPMQKSTFIFISQSLCQIGIVSDIANGSSPKLLQNFMGLGIIRMQMGVFLKPNTTSSANKRTCLPGKRHQNVANDPPFIGYSIYT